LQQAKQGFDSAMTSAQDAVANAQATYDATMRAAEKKVDDANKAFDAKIDAAQKVLDKAEKKWNATFDNATAAVTSGNNYVNALNDKIKALKKEKKDAPWYDVPELEIKIGAKEVEKDVAQGILDLAKTVLRDIETCGDFLAFDTAGKALDDTRKACQKICDDASKALEAARKGTDFVAFQAAQNALSIVQNGVEYTAMQAANDALNFVQASGQVAIDASKNVLKDVDNSVNKYVLDAAKSALNAIASGPLADAYNAALAAESMVDYGLEKINQMADALINAGMNAFYFDSISVSASMKDVLAGKLFSAATTFHLLGHSYSLTFDESFNFADLKVFAQSVYNQVLQEMDTLVG
jgi:hypothetical protein